MVIVIKIMFGVGRVDLSVLGRIMFGRFKELIDF